MFDGFQLSTIDAGGVSIRVRHGGHGPPLLLLHGHPQTHVMWHRVAPRLARHFTVVATDLRGYGDSGKPPTTADHAPYSKRAMAADQIGVMRQLGFDRFFVAGHDRGGRCAYRMALDHPDRVLKLAVLDIIPTADAFRRADSRLRARLLALVLSRPAVADPGASDRSRSRLFLPGAADVRAWSRGTLRARSARGVSALLPDSGDGPCDVRGLSAAATVDIAHDEADRGVRRIACPVLALWGRKAKLDQWYDVLGIWRGWADDVRGRALECGHYLAEEAPDDTSDELVRFFS